MFIKKIFNFVFSSYSFFLGVLFLALASFWILQYVCPHWFYTKETISKRASLNIYRMKWKPTNYFDDPTTLRLCRAIVKRDVDKVQRLIDSGADVNAKGKDNMPLLLWSIFSGEEVFECLLKNGANPNIILESNYELPTLRFSPGNTLLYVSVSGSKSSVLKNYIHLLLKYGADPNLGKKKPLIHAVTFHGRDIITSLIEAGADVNLPEIHTFQAYLGYPDEYRYPITEYMLRQSELLVYFLERGAIYDVNTQQGSELQRYLYRAVVARSFTCAPQTLKDYERAVQWLKDHGVSFDEPAPEIIPGPVQTE